jgi:hypothetical protein
MNDHDDNRRDETEQPEEIELTAAEKEALDKLPRDRVPSPLLEDRLAGVLRQRGILAPPRGRVIEVTPRRIIAALAACLALLAGGFAFGQWVGTHEVADDEFTAPEISNMSVAAQLQQAGSAYVMALQRFAELPDSVDGDQAVQGREVALTTLCTAAGRVSRLVPRSELTGQILTTLDADWSARTTGDRGAIDVRSDRVIEF